jgi:hypothetical protein
MRTNSTMIRMKALKSFRGARPIEGRPKRGREFTTDSERRADELEAHGLAYRLEYKAAPPPPDNKTEPVPANKAAADGPFDSDGGTTGEAAPAPSSLQDPPRRRRRSKVSEDDLLS